MKFSHAVILLVMNFFWAAVYSAYKVIGQTLPTGAIVTLRFGLAGLFLLFFWPWLPGAAPRGRSLVITCLLGLLVFVIGQRLQVYGNQLGTAGNSAVLIALEPLIVSLAAAVVLREHLGPRRCGGFVLGMIGVALLNEVWSRDFRWSGLAASSIFVSSFFCEAAYSVVGKPIVQRFSPMKMLTISLLVGTIANLLIDGPSTLAAARSLTSESWFVIVMLGVVCTSVGYSVWFVVIRDCPVTVAALTVFAQSVFGVPIAAVWLHDRVTWGQLWGSLAIVAGLVLGLSRQIQRKTVVSPIPE